MNESKHLIIYWPEQLNVHWRRTKRKKNITCHMKNCTCSHFWDGTKTVAWYKHKVNTLWFWMNFHVKESYRLWVKNSTKWFWVQTQVKWSNYEKGSCWNRAVIAYWSSFSFELAAAGHTITQQSIREGSFSLSFQFDLAASSGERMWSDPASGWLLVVRFVWRKSGEIKQACSLLLI